ncbi:MAG: hypothetical protein PWQ10_560 [Patescibacteria group bacterium]|nr:hypothetical protein [Patescibacteria group bacterium]
MGKQSLSKRIKQHNILGCEYSPGLISSPNKSKNQKSFGFTIVELLVVIVVIGILAAITIVSYTGITNRANKATVQAELSNASKKLAIYYAENGTYPTNDLVSNNGCPLTPVADTQNCVKFGSGTSYTYVFKTASTYDLTATKGTVSYKVSDGGAPADVSGSSTPITAIASITGTAQTSQTLTAGAITPAAATVNYQWQSATTAGGTYTNIPGATSNTLTLNPSNINKYIKVVVTGTGSYTGTQTSVASSQIATDTNWKVMGSQVWATANLNVGTRIAGTTAQTNNATTEKYCYGDTESNCTTYGGLYQWDEAMGYTNTEGVQGICPVGSHIPSDNEWKILEMSLSGMTQTVADTTGWRGTDEGTKLKSGGSSGLNMPLAGIRYTDGSFSSLSSYADLWSSSESSTSAWRRGLYSGFATVYRGTDTKDYGFSVRCLGN